MWAVGPVGTAAAQSWGPRTVAVMSGFRAVGWREVLFSSAARGVHSTLLFVRRSVHLHQVH